MITKYPGQNIPPDPPDGAAASPPTIEVPQIPKLHWIQVLTDTLLVKTSPPRKDSPVSQDSYYHVKYIDDQLNAIKDRLTALETRATNLEGRVTSLEGRATVVEGRATVVEGRATVVEGRASTLESGLTTTKADLTTATDKVKAIEGMVNPPEITSSGSNYNKTIGSNFAYQITATNTPASYGASGLPSGLSVNSTGYISGTINDGPNIYNVTVSATNIGGTGTKSFTITVT